MVAVRRRGRRSSPATADLTARALADDLRRVFKLFDDDETGRISFRNLKRVARELGENVTDEELQEMINTADLDGDGEVNEDEFMRIMTCKQALALQNGLGGRKDEAEARRLFGLAAAQGHEQAREAQDVLAARREKEAKKAERRTQKKQNRRMKYAAANASAAGESPEAARQRIETQLVRAATEEDEALEATRVAAEERRKRERRIKEREEEAAARQCQIQQREYELELMQAASKQRAAATPAKAKRGGEGLDGKEVTQKTQSISRALEHSEELRQREAAARHGLRRRRASWRFVAWRTRSSAGSRERESGEAAGRQGVKMTSRHEATVRGEIDGAWRTWLPVDHIER